MTHIIQNDRTALRISETRNPFLEPPKYYFIINLPNKKLAVADRMIFNESMWCVDIGYAGWALLGLGMGCLFALMYSQDRDASTLSLGLIILGTGVLGMGVARMASTEKKIIKLYIDKQRGDIYIDWYNTYGHHSDCKLSCDDFEGFTNDSGDSSVSTLFICFKSLGRLELASDTSSKELQMLKTTIKAAIEEAIH